MTIWIAHAMAHFLSPCRNTCRDSVAIPHNPLIRNIYLNRPGSPDCSSTTPCCTRFLQVTLQRPSVYVRAEHC